MSSYQSLAGCYDAFTADVDYAAWAEYLCKHFALSGERVETVLDLACGTGSLSMLLAEAGFEVIGADASEEMLAIAQAKAWSAPEPRPMFLHQDMEHLDLYGTVDAAVCCLDSLNYLASAQALYTAIGRLRYFVRPGGLLIFDVNTDAKFRALDGCAFLRESPEYFCAWSAEYQQQERLCTFYYDIFRRSGSLWAREQEEHVERAHAEEELAAALAQAGFCLNARFGELSFEPPAAGAHRIFYVARREENGER